MITENTTRAQVCDMFAAVGIDAYIIENCKNPLHGFAIGYGVGMPNNPFGWDVNKTVAYNRGLLAKAEALGFMKCTPDRIVNQGYVIALLPSWAWA